MTCYEILEEYIESQRPDIERGNPIVIEIRDINTFERLVVKALIGVPGQPLDGGDSLILKNLAENVVSDQWTIKVLEELDTESVSVQPQSSFRKQAPDGA